MPTKKRRIRSPHPGVVIKERPLPSGRITHRARFTDPDTGRETYVTLNPTALPTHEARRLWAIQRSKTLGKRVMDIEAGAPMRIERTVAEAAQDYRKAAARRLRDKTLEAYAPAIKRLVTWVEHEGVSATADLTQAKLSAFRNHVVGVRRKRAKRKGKRGERHETAQRRSPNSVNSELRAVKTVLNEWRVAGLTPQLTSDSIADALKALPVPREQAEYLNPAAIRKLLEAAQRHDADTFAATRAELSGIGAKGTTRRYVPIAQFTAFLLLTGCRRGEALALKWSDVDLEAVDAQGSKVGEIRLKAAATKTKHARTIGLEVSPALRAMLATMKLRAGDSDYVFSTRDSDGEEHPYTSEQVDAARARLVRVESKGDKGRKDKAERGYGAPKFDWQLLRSTCATYLTNAPAIFGSASVYLSARQLGHSVTVAEKHYLGVHRGIPRDARTLDAAMQVEATLGELSGAKGATRAKIAAVS